MPAKTQNINGILEISGNVYVAAMVIAKRARQINDELYQKKRDRQILEELEGGFEDEFMKAEEEEGEPKEAVDDEDNPVTYAQSEFFDLKLDFEIDS